MTKTKNLEVLFDHLWQKYITDSPQAGAIHQLFVDQGEEVINDHIALRTFDDPRVNVDKLGRFFCELGYKESGEYHFPIKKLFAKHYEHPDLMQPKIFISELKTTEFSEQLQRSATCCIDAIDSVLQDSSTLLYSGVSWAPLDYSVYQEFLKESEYAAWLYAFGFRANHFTVNVNHMKKLNSIEKVNQLLKTNGYVLNVAGGEIKGTPSDFLEQSSTLANRVAVHFKQGDFEIPNSYYEFARRYKDKSCKLYQGFVAASADKIFESTDVNKKN